MSVSDSLIRDAVVRLFPTLDYERARREIVLALEGGQWTNHRDLFRAIRHNPRGEFGVGPGTFSRTLIKLEDEGLIETRQKNVGLTAYESRRMYRLTEYGSSELKQMGADNV